MDLRRRTNDQYNAETSFRSKVSPAICVAWLGRAIDSVTVTSGTPNAPLFIDVYCSQWHLRGPMLPAMWIGMFVSHVPNLRS